MKHLPLPVTAAEDDDVILRLCGDASWSPHRDNWLSTYAAYQNHAGDPWVMEPFEFGGNVATRQYDLYDNRATTLPMVKIRRTKGVLSCPLCGSPTKGTLDHYLPRETYPEFSIMRANLLPACSHCNSGVKRQTFKGDRAPKRFIHPYFDRWADGPLWIVKIQRPFEAATFKGAPSPSVPADKAEIVQFHLDNVLGNEFDQAMENHWSTLPSVIKIRAEISPGASIETLIDAELRSAAKNSGRNGWYTAFYRGLALDREAMVFVSERLAELPDEESGEEWDWGDAQPA